MFEFGWGDVPQRGMAAPGVVVLDIGCLLPRLGGEGVFDQFRFFSVPTLHERVVVTGFGRAHVLRHGQAPQDLAISLPVSAEAVEATRHPKGRLQLFLAVSRRGQAVSHGAAAKERAVDIDHPAFEPLKAFLLDLAGGYSDPAI
jgi:hypothetical protein